MCLKKWIISEFLFHNNFYFIRNTYTSISIIKKRREWRVVIFGGDGENRTRVEKGIPYTSTIYSLSSKRLLEQERQKQQSCEFSYIQFRPNSSH